MNHQHNQPTRESAHMTSELAKIRSATGVNRVVARKLWLANGQNAEAAIRAYQRSK